MKTITDKFGHRIRVKEWPSQEGMQKLRTHYRDKHPAAFKGWPKELQARKPSRSTTGGKKTPRKLSPGVHNVRVKKPSGGTRMQRVQVLKNGKWKFLKNKPGGGGRGTTAKKPGAKKSPSRRAPSGSSKASKPAKKKSNPGGGGSSTGSSNRRAKIGASYQAFRTGGAALSPLTDKGLRALGPGGTLEESGQILEAAVRARGDQLVLHEVGVGLDAAFDKEFQQAAAISRGSATAIGPELYAGYKAWKDTEAVQGAVPRLRAIHRRALEVEFGFDPDGIVQDLNDPAFKTYRIGKHGGQLLRRARSKIPFVKKMTEPVAKLFRMMGGTI